MKQSINLIWELFLKLLFKPSSFHQFHLPNNSPTISIIDNRSWERWKSINLEGNVSGDFFSRYHCRGISWSISKWLRNFFDSSSTFFSWSNSSQHVRKAHSIRNEKSWNRHFILVLLAGTRRNPFRQEPSIIISSNPFWKQQSEPDKSFWASENNSSVR